MLGASLAVAASGLDAIPSARKGLAVGLGAIGLIGMWNPMVRKMIPQRQCQVDPALMLRGAPKSVMGLRWGAELGLGFRTYVVTTAMFVLAGCLLQLGGWLAIGCGGAYGLTRAGVIAIYALVKRDHSARQLPGLVDHGQLSRLLARPLGVVANLSVLAIILQSMN